MLTRALILGLTTSLLFSGAARADENRPGVTNAEILIGQTNPYSGPLSAYGTQGRAQAAYYKMVNDEGGVNGRKTRAQQFWIIWADKSEQKRLRRLGALSRRGVTTFPEDLITPKEIVTVR